MDGEITIFFKLWFQVLLSTWYCYLVARVVPKGTTRLISISPVICHFLILPLKLSSFHFGIITSYFISWLANFKLLLFAFGLGPLSGASLSLGRFALLLCLPIKIKENPPPKSPKKLILKPHRNHITKQSNGLNNGEIPIIGSSGGLKSPLNYATKAFLSLVCIFVVDHYKDHADLRVIYIILGIYIYMSLEILLAAMAVVAQVFLGTYVEPQFGEPYLSSSLKDFWGRHWNLMSSDVLSLTIYKPILQLTTPVVGPKMALIPAILGTFLVSGFMHELLFYHVGRLGLTWGTILYFVLNALFVLIEIGISNFMGKWRLPRIVSGPLILGLQIVVFGWLVMPGLLRWNVVDRAMSEYEAVGNFVMDLFWSSSLAPCNTSSG